MLTIYSGAAGSGKSLKIMHEIKDRANTGEKSILIVPEQYSHDAERQLCSICGDGISLYAEVLSFTRLYNRVMSLIGSDKRTLDAGGRLLIMTGSLSSCAPLMKTIGVISRKAQTASELLEVYDEFRAAKLSPEGLGEIALKLDPPLCDKLNDLSILFADYESKIPDGMKDPSERLDELCMYASKSDACTGRKIYVDGFTDFTHQESAVIESFIESGYDVCAAFTYREEDKNESAFVLPAKTAAKLASFAEENGAEVKRMVIEKEDGDGELAFLEKNLFRKGVTYAGESRNIKVFSAQSVEEECAKTASYIRDLVRDHGYRWRDIAVSVRGWEQYAPVAEGIFNKYSVPLQYVKKSDILEKPVMALICAALDTVTKNWDIKSVFKYLRTCVAGIGPEDTDELYNYVSKWNIRGFSAWNDAADWTENPDGYTDIISPDSEERLARINNTRRRAAAPLCGLSRGLSGEKTAGGKMKALYEFTEAVMLANNIETRAEVLETAGRGQTADEYRQLWGILVGAMEQFYDILKDEPIGTDEFAELFKLMLSKYSVATIPASIDRVSIGETARMKRRGLKYLFIMGADEDSMPKVSGSHGLLSDADRERLSKCGVTLGQMPEYELCREMNVIYSAFTLPEDGIYVSWNESKGRGKPSYIVSGIFDTFGISDDREDDSSLINSQSACFETAVSKGGAALKYIMSDEDSAERYRRVKNAAESVRGRISARSASKLYSEKLNLTASRIDDYHSCRFKFFMRYGLKAKPRETAQFDAIERGNYIHFLLENTVRDSESTGGIGKLSHEACVELARKYTKQYEKNVLNGFTATNGRLKYLFSRLASDAENIICDMAQEMSRSKFKTIDCELGFGPSEDISAILKDGKSEISVVGRVDRVDGFEKDGKLYIRIVDYKTGKKTFKLSDVLYGRGIQMLLYLFVLTNEGGKRYGREIVPAGVLYAPARDVFVDAKRDDDDEKIESERAKSLKRSGLLLSEEEIIQAMEEEPMRFLPSDSKGRINVESLATAEQLGKLWRHISDTLFKMAKELRNGAIDACPTPDACDFCEYAEACHFDDGHGDDRVRYLPSYKTAEAWEKIAGGEDCE